MLSMQIPHPSVQHHHKDEQVVVIDVVAVVTTVDRFGGGGLHVFGPLGSAPDPDSLARGSQSE